MQLLKTMISLADVNHTPTERKAYLFAEVARLDDSDHRVEIYSKLILLTDVQLMTGDFDVD